MHMFTRVLVAAAACAVIAGCSTTTAEMISRPETGTYAPTSGRDFGLIRFLADGSAADQDARQQDAYRQMHDACGGHYRVLGKGTRDQLNLSAAGPLGRRGMVSSENYVYIKFVCTRE
jgi:hypothetical protein